MKKILLAVLCCLTFSLTACGSQSDAASATAESVETAAEEAVETSVEEVMEESEEAPAESVEVIEAEAVEEPVTEPAVDPATIVPENPAYDDVYRPIFEEVQNTPGQSDYATVYFSDTNGDGVVEMWIDRGGTTECDEYYEVYTIRESGAVMLDHVEGSWVPYETRINFPSPTQFFEVFNVVWPGMDTILSFDGPVSGLTYK